MSATVERLRKWLHNGADMASLDEKGNSRLHRAIEENDPETVSVLLEYGANPLLPNNEGLTPIDFACYLQRPACRQVLELHESETFYLQTENIITPVPRYEMEEIFHFTHSDHLLFPCIETIEYVSYLTANFISEKQQKLALSFGEKYANQIQKGQTADLFVSFVDNDIGYGLFSKKTIEKGSYIGEYVGEIIQPLKGQDPSYQMKYILDTINGQALIIDAKKKGNLLRFANHEENGNIQPVIAHLHNLIHVIFLASRPIQAHEQLCYDYGRGHWKSNLQSKSTKLKPGL